MRCGKCENALVEWKGWVGDYATWVCPKCNHIEKIKLYSPKPRGYKYGVPTS